MNKRILIALVLAAAGVSAFAGFIDERTGEKPAPATGAFAPVSTVRGSTSSGVDPVNIQIDSSAIGASWRIAPGDSTISSALARWSSQSGYQVIWQAEKDLPSYSASYEGGFESAIEALMIDTKNSGYPLHACLYDNKVVRVLHVTQTCGQ